MPKAYPHHDINEFVMSLYIEKPDYPTVSQQEMPSGKMAFCAEKEIDPKSSKADK
jgi:hypothetical protein